MVDLLLDNEGVVVKIAKDIKLDCTTFNCNNNIVCPAFVDGHEHILYDKFYTVKGLIDSGVGTVVGCLANENKIEAVEKLISVTNTLNKKHNIKAYCLAGSKNFTEDIENFIIKNDCVVGIKSALFSDQRPKPNLSYEKLKRDSVATYKAGLITNKNVQVHLHLDHPFARGEKPDINKINMGDCDNLPWIDKIVKETGVPYSLFKLTHSQKYYKRILEYANKGVYLDYTAFDGEYDRMYDDLVFAIKNKTVDVSKISISSDLGLLSMERNLVGEETPITLLNTVRHLVFDKNIKLEDALALITTSALSPIVKKTDMINVGEKCPLLILDKNLNILKKLNFELNEKTKFDLI